MPVHVDSGVVWTWIEPLESWDRTGPKRKNQYSTPTILSRRYMYRGTSVEGWNDLVM
jgi:hypothetical protein